MASPETARLLPSIRQHFNLSQPALVYCLGLSRTMVSQGEGGLRSLPQAALTLALQATVAPPRKKPPTWRCCSGTSAPASSGPTGSRLNWRPCLSGRPRPGAGWCSGAGVAGSVCSEGPGRVGS